MLVLSRKESQVIKIGDNISIMLVRIQGGKVRIGIEAPKNVPVIRAELARLPNVSKIPGHHFNGDEPID